MATDRTAGVTWSAQDRLGAAIDAINLPDLLNELCPSPQTAGLSRERGGTICDPRPGREERRPSFSVSRRQARWLWHRFGTDEGGSAFELMVGLGWGRGAAAAELVRRAGLEALDERLAAALGG